MKSIIWLAVVAALSYPVMTSSGPVPAASAGLVLASDQPSDDGPEVLLTPPASQAVPSPAARGVEAAQNTTVLDLRMQLVAVEDERDNLQKEKSQLESVVAGQSEQIYQLEQQLRQQRMQVSAPVVNPAPARPTYATYYYQNQSCGTCRRGFFFRGR